MKKMIFVMMIASLLVLTLMLSFGVRAFLSASPQATFTWSPLQSFAGETVTFNASASSSEDEMIVSYEWNFGDGNITITSGPIMTHIYAQPEEYYVFLNVTDSEGLWSMAMKHIVVREGPNPVVDWWPMFRHDLPHSGCSTSKAPNTNQTLWSYITGDVVLSSPAVVDGRIFVGSHDYKLYALNATTGEFIWSYTTGGEVFSSPVVVDGRVSVGSYDGNVYALNVSNGGFIWSYTTGVVDSSPAIADGRLYIGSWDYKVYALNATTGEFIWSYTTGGPVVSSPTVADGRVSVGSNDGNLYALNATTGELIWSYTTGYYVDSSPSVAHDMVYVGSSNTVYCLNATTGQFVWSYTTGDYVFSSPAVADGKLYFGSYDGNLYALNATTGELIWSQTAGSLGLSSPAVADGKLYVGSGDQKVYCLDATTGARIWSYTTGYPVHSSPAVGDGKVFIGSMDKSVYAFGVNDVAVTNVTCTKTRVPAIVGQGYVTLIMVTVENQGTSSETFDVTAYYNETAILVETWSDAPQYQIFWSMGDVSKDGYIDDWDMYVISMAYGSYPGNPRWNPDADINSNGQVNMQDLSTCGKNYGKNIWAYFGIPKIIKNHKGVTLSSEKSAIITFRWNTTGVTKGNYTLNARTTQVLGETDITDNTYSNGWIFVSIPGDIASPYKQVDMKDIGTVVKAFGSDLLTSGPEWNPNADINHDTRVDMKDIGIAVTNFGKTW